MKVIGIGKIVSSSGVAKNTPKTAVKIGKSGLPLEEPLDVFEKEKQYIYMLSPEYSLERSMRELQVKIDNLSKK